MPSVRKPGTALRATAAFALLNVPLIGVTAFVWFLANGAADFWLRTFIGVAVSVAEFAIVSTTIGPPLYDWIKSEEYVQDGQKPSWEKRA